LQELKLSPPLSFHGIKAWYRLRAKQQAQEAKEAIRQQEVIISSPFVFATTPVSKLFGRHQQTTSDQGAVFAKTKLYGLYTIFWAHTGCSHSSISMAKLGANVPEKYKGKEAAAKARAAHYGEEEHVYQ